MEEIRLGSRPMQRPRRSWSMVKSKKLKVHSGS